MRIYTLELRKSVLAQSGFLSKRVTKILAITATKQHIASHYLKNYAKIRDGFSRLGYIGQNNNN